MPKKSRKKKEKVVSLPATTYPIHEVRMCGFRIIKANYNQLWRWDNLENVKIDLVS